ncbi:LLM class flavin-dependent oxidoreductase [Halorarius halobius]|uniref:LLM class flavin-dependent oxidoreductase n=1 Tax=Halorarius halobius TaxID=2962671 RepID=UPI0020CED168|nr:LLM class flavin-dependent oxidoreductase [Halorarius halobius]
MVYVSTFHNGSTNLPVKEADNGMLIVDGSVSELHEDMKQVVKDQIDYGVIADQVGFDAITLTEHHFEVSGVEFSPNPLMTEMAIASQTEDIRLCQMANIITFHDPVRMAEMTAMLDVASDGRAELGFGRGAYPRESETFGQYWGGSNVHEEMNRTSYEEKLEIIKQAWTEDLMSYTGQFHNVPPKHTRWHHPQEYAYFEDEVTDPYTPEDLNRTWDEDAPQGNWTHTDPDYPEPLLQATDSTLNSLSVFPQPHQEPHPQIWQPVVSPRSLKFAARNGHNVYLVGGPLPMIKDRIEIYYEEAEKAGWPDHRPEYDGEPFAYGWDDDRNRGCVTRRYIFNTDVADEETLERWKQGVKHEFDWYDPRGVGRRITQIATPEIQQKVEEAGGVTAEVLKDMKLGVYGDTDEIIDLLAHVKEFCGYEDFAIDVQFEIAGLSGEEINTQLEAFGERVIPHLEEEF